MVFDTNILVSTLIKHGKPRELWNNVLEDRIKLFTSEEILSEFSEVIIRPELKKYVRRSRMERLRKILIQKAVLTRVKTRFPQATKDPDDNIVLEAAYSARADYIVSGDKDLLALREFMGIRIVTVDKMLDVLTNQD
ncbi:MAG: putative toxin-antitoxin system toxin component, PIN family [Thaumarchaeota archaeon]|nr:putative toxin-antitoxin system toxin component, PIN family [Nitrososphaerota archaeon]